MVEPGESTQARTPDVFKTPLGSAGATPSPGTPGSPTFQSFPGSTLGSRRVTFDENFTFHSPSRSVVPQDRKPSGTNNGGTPQANPLSKKISNLFAHRKNLNMDREEWSSHWQFVLFSMLYSVGFFNIHTFPLYVMEYGGIAFLIPYLLVCFLIVLPMVILETALGQFTSRGPTHCWGFARMFTCLGYAMVLRSCLFISVYASTLGKVLYYFIESILFEPDWIPGDTDTSLVMNHTVDSKELNTDVRDCTASVHRINRESESEVGHRIFYNTQQKYVNHEYFGEAVNWYWASCAIFVHLLALVSSTFMVRSSFKLSCVAVVCVYGPMTALLIYALQLPGSSDGLRHFMEADTSKLLATEVWVKAAKLAFFSIGVASGVWQGMASYNNFHQNTITNAFYVILGDIAWSIISCCVVFSLLGYLVHESKIDMDDILNGSKRNIMYVVIPTALGYGSNVRTWCALYFLTVFLAGWTSHLWCLEPLLTGVMDVMKFTKGMRKYVALVIFIIICISTPPLCSLKGYSIALVMENYFETLTYSPLLLLELIAITRIYGTVNFISDIELMIGWGTSRLLERSTSKLIWGTLWGWVAPICLIIDIIFELTNLDCLVAKEQPLWVNVMGVICLTSIHACTFGMMIYLLVIEKGSFTERFRRLLKPSEVWGPAKTHHRYMWELLRKEDLRHEPVFSFTGYLLPLMWRSLPSCVDISLLNNKPPPPKKRTFWEQRGHFRSQRSSNVTTFSELSLSR